jgi:hypothetical protein
MTPPSPSRDELLAQLADLRERAIGDVRAAAQLTADAGAQLDEAVRSARHAGASWADIATAAGMSRQGAQQRWADR